MINSRPYETFKGFPKGINNVDDPLSLSSHELTLGSNIDLDNDGIPSRRKGRTLWKTGAYKWLYPTSFGMLAVRANNLVLLFADASEVILRSDLLPDLHMVYERVLDRVYYTNSQVIGYVRAGSNVDLPQPSELNKTILPAGKFLRYHNARLYVGTGNKLIMSDPGKFDQYDERFFGKQFEAPMTMVEAVKDGLFIGAGYTYFLNMADPMEIKPGALTRVAEYDAIPYTATKIDGGLVVQQFGQPKTIPGTVIIWGSEMGICLGTNGGDFENLTAQRYRLPAGARYGAVIYRKENHKKTSQVIMTVYK